MAQSSRILSMNATQRIEKRPLLDDDDTSSHDEASFNEQQQQEQQNRRRCLTFWPFVLLFQIVISGAIIAVLSHRLSSLQSSKSVQTQDTNYDHLKLLRPTIKYTVSTPGKDWWDQPLYTDLTFESGMAWHDLLEKQAFRISPEEMEHYGIPTSLWEDRPLDSGGYPGVMSVFHNLHCVRHIKQELFKEYYFPERTPEEAAGRVEHTKHCLEVLRQSAMCNADLTPLALNWSREQNTSFVKSESRRRCADWDSLIDSVKDRQYRYDEIIPKDL